MASDRVGAAEVEREFGAWLDAYTADWEAQVRQRLEEVGPPDRLHGGLADGRTDADFDPEALAEGRRVEMEHTDDPALATEIARDHLAEDPRYYEKLRWVEGKALEVAKEHSYSSTQFDVPEGKYAEVWKILRDLQSGIPDDALAGDGKEGDLHLTVKYGLHADDAAEVRRLVEGFGPVEVTLTKVGVFRADEDRCQRGGAGCADVVMVEVESERLRELNRLLSRLPHTDTHPDYRPHITLAYVEPGRGAEFMDLAQGALPVTMSWGDLQFSDKRGGKITVNLIPTTKSWPRSTASGKDCGLVPIHKALGWRPETKDAEVTGRRRDRLGRERCYERGVLVACPENREQSGGRGAGVQESGDQELASFLGKYAPDPRKLTAPPCCLYLPDTARPNDATGVPDAALVGVPAMSVPPPPNEIPRLPNLTRKQREVETRFADAYLADPDGMARKYLKALRKRKVGEYPNIFATDDVKMLNRDWNPGRARVGEQLPEESKKAMAKYNAAVHQTANAVAKRAFLMYLDELPAGKRTVLVTNGGCAAGKGSTLSRTNKPGDPHYGMLPAAEQVGAIWDAAGEQNATENPWIYEECRKRGIEVTFAYVWADPEKTWDAPDRGVVRRAMRKGRMVGARVFADSYALGAKNMKAFHDGYRNKPGAQFVFIDNRDKAAPRLLPDFPAETLQWDAGKIMRRAVSSLAKVEGEMPPALMRGGLNDVTIWGFPK